MKIDYNNYWNADVFHENAENNKKNIEYTIDDLKLSSKKILVCGRGEKSHPDFSPRFSTPTTNIDSNVFVTVDHDPQYTKYITRKGNYALSLIVDPSLPKTIIKLGGKVFWFSSKEIISDIPNLVYGKFPKGNSGLAAISLAGFLKTKHILLSGIKLSDDYKKFLPGKDIVFKEIQEQGTKIFSLDGKLAEKINFKAWCDI